MKSKKWLKMPNQTLRPIKKLRELVDARNQLDSLIHATKKSITELGDKIDGKEKADIESQITNAESALKEDNLEKLMSKSKIYLIYPKSLLKSCILKVNLIINKQKLAMITIVHSQKKMMIS